MKIGFGNDHTAFELKRELMEYLGAQGHEVVDFGAGEGERMDYPIPAKAVAEAIIRGDIDKGVLICGTGIGISISANKVKGIRAAVCSEPYSAAMASLHNNAHIIAMGARVVGSELAKAIIDAFFTTEYEGGRHQARLDLISDIEKEQE